MKTLKIVSWNLRTFGDPIPPDVALRGMAAIIVGVLQPDIVCIQEIQPGPNVFATIGAPISPAIDAALEDLLGKLDAAEPLAGWQLAVSGVNSARSVSMCDAYAFFWKATPGNSPLSHADAPPLIVMLQLPEILRQPGGDKFPGRRPGMIPFEITSEPNAPPVVLNVISWHAATPCNAYGKAKNGPSSGRALMALATLTEIGGTLRRDKSGGWGDYEWIDGQPLPDVDTIFLGDCNFSMSASKADVVYRNLTTNYTPCVSTFTNIVNTTYSADPTKPFSSVSSYDNIFLLNARQGFSPAVTFTGASGAYDFIAAEARRLGGVSGIQYFADDAAWYVCFLDNYKRQCAQFGISDHLPVWAEFQVDEGLANSQEIRPTSGADNNCLFHATFGVENGVGVYVDAGATLRRTQLANAIEQAMISKNIAAIRDHVLRVMINEFGAAPTWLGVAQNLLANPLLDPFLAPEWEPMVVQYLAGIRGGRMLYADEAAMVAIQANITIELWIADAGEYRSLTLNAGHTVTDIYHFGVHFFRFEPN